MDDYYLPIDPLELTVATLDEATNILFNFVAEYHNLDIPDEQMCEIFFNQYDHEFNCVEGREDFILSGGYVMVMSQVLEVDLGELEDNYFMVELQFYDPVTGYETFTQYFYAYVTLDGYVFIEFTLDPGE